MRGSLFGVAGRASSGVDVTFSATAAHARDGDLELAFPFESTRLSSGGTDGEMLVLEAVSEGAKRTLYVPLAAALEALPSDAPVTVRDEVARLAATSRGHGRRAALVFVAVAAACALAGFAIFRLVDRALARAVDAIPPSWEASLGRAALAAHAATADVVTEPRITGPVRAIVARLTAHVKDAPYTFTVQVWRSREVNAFALPGGPIVVYTGLLAQAGGPDEVAGVLAHELEHVLNRHSLRALATSLKWNLALMLLMGDIEGLREALLRQAGRMAQLSHSRDAEREADRDAVDLLIRAGIDPAAMARFFSKLSSESGHLDFLSTHPGHAERVATVHALAGARGAVPRTPLDVDWGALKKALAELDPKGD